MRKISRERVNQLARDLLEAMLRGKSVTLLKDRDVVRQSIAHALADEFKREEDRQQTVRNRIATMKGAPPSGSDEWDELFAKFLEEEYVRDGLEG